jgi:hypothetical protein
MQPPYNDKHAAYDHDTSQVAQFYLYVSLSRMNLIAADEHAVYQARPICNF